MSGRLNWIADELEAVARSGLRREPENIGEAQGPVAVVDGRRLVNLCSDDYLGLASDPRTRLAAAQAARSSGAGAGAPRPAGDLAHHRELEQRLAGLAGTEAALLFSSVHHAGAGVPAALVGPEDAIFADELNQASVADGCQLSRARVQRYRHGDVGDLERLLTSTVARRKLVVTESVFGMEGDAVPLAEVASLCRRRGAMLYLDEAHALGVLGRRGAGLAEEAGLCGEVDVTVSSLGTALGSFGAFAAGSRALVEWLVSSCRTLAFGCALPPAACGAALAALDVLETEPELRSRLASLSTRMKDGLECLGFSTERVVAPIFSLKLGEERLALQASLALRRRGYLTLAVGPPLVPPGTSRLRVSLTAVHSREQVDGFLVTLREVLQDLGWKPAAPTGR